jgi:predicted nucleic acid-binding protein
LKLFLDANVVFSAAHQEAGNAQALLALARAGHCAVLTSAHALEEARRNLALKSSRYEKRLAEALAVIGLVSYAPRALVVWGGGLGLPLKDAPILAAAVHAGAEVLVTGDARDFGALYERTLRGVQVLTPARALALVLKQAGV